MLDFRMDTFLAVCRRMNFTRAAEDLHITQPAVSQHIHWLEQEYGAKLFLYGGRKLQLTEAGRLLLAAATTIRHDNIHLREQIGRLGDAGGTLNFGATLTIGSYILPPRLARYLQRHPGETVRMTVANTRELLKKLDSGEIDFAVVEGFFEKSEYDSLPFSRERFVAVCGADYPLAERNSVKPRPIEDLLGERLILREPGSGTREVFEKFLETCNLSLRDFSDVIEIGGIEGIRTMAQMGCGVTFLYEAAVRQELAAGTLREVALDGFPLLHDFTFLWRRGSIFDGYYRELFEQLREDAG